MPLVILHHLLNVFVQLANKRGFKWFSSGPLLLPFNLPIKTALWKATVSPAFLDHLTGLMGHYSAKQKN
jgi:hypothetical protein